MLCIAHTFLQGFFDATSLLHTVEIEAPGIILASTHPLASNSATSSTDDMEILQLKRSLVNFFKEIGYDEEFNTWWIPNEALSKSPLLCAIRAMLMTKNDLKVLLGRGDVQEAESDDEIQRIAELMKHPISLETEAKRKLGCMLQNHLRRYTPCSKQGPDGDDCNAPSGDATTTRIYVSRRLVGFEQNLLKGHLNAIS